MSRSRPHEKDDDEKTLRALIATVSASVAGAKAEYNKSKKDLKDSYDSTATAREETIAKLRQRLELIEHRKKNPLPTGVDESKLLTLDDIVDGCECMESYPCQHDVSIKGAKPQPMDGPDVAKLYMANYLPVPAHFKEYMNWKDD